MIPLSEYPHMPYWFTLRQAMAMLQSSRIEVEGKVSLPRAFLVFNEAYELLGVMRRLACDYPTRSPLRPDN